jgi:hypothetical protein
MRAGRFDANGETIKLDYEGDLIDGQHRLTAVSDAGVAQWFLVVRGLPPEAQETVDIGKRRHLGGQLTLGGEKDGNILAAAGRMVYAYEAIGIPVAKVLAIKPTDPQIRDVLARHPGIQDSIAKICRGIVLSRSTCVGLHYLFTHVEPEDADYFFQKLASGAGLEPRDPILILRERLMREKMAVAGRRYDVKVLTAFTIRAFNAYRRNERLSKLQWGGASAQFPRIIGCDIPIIGHDESVLS